MNEHRTRSNRLEGIVDGIANTGKSTGPHGHFELTKAYEAEAGVKYTVEVNVFRETDEDTELVSEVTRNGLTNKQEINDLLHGVIEL